ncbi:helix-turn-helix transcriptional regulator [filamentous cyanobacterium LEGE 11480]|uniref:Helix-turn-helix transcriptional regulator n=1 Tax=Romeriopsis navalis LEGE 11480 TaxID=2777977 RepID=A0A928VJ65_9CYAN|nr:LuxR C-terminal-related transcriptional regulator [Romeriopsis navalis]MBE9029310.1 helix-turn-helix transcriptional regulator [Romeriopsis navalis LEGE 11480]
MIIEIPLLETKLYLPRWSADLVSRPRLIDRIQPQRKLTLISAPAGFGKTTLLAEWIAAIPTRPVAWVSLEPSDNESTIFWTYLITALQNIQPHLGGRARSLLQSPQPPPIESVLMTLLNELTTIEANIALVLDDYHAIETPAIHSSIGFLLNHLPPQIHLIIASRADPPLALARLRSHGELTELRVSDLRFTPDEAAAFLNQAMGLAISAVDVSALEQRTEGWIAGLQLAALSLQGREDIPDFVAAFSGDDRYIVDYLMEEVLQRQPDRIRRFLLQTAILERLSGSLCDAVTQQTDGQAMLETLERGNLFIIPLDNKRQWYRYHHLFADVLLAHAQTAWPEQLPQIHGRASEWYEQKSLFSDAIRHALAAQEFERAASLIEQVWPTMRNRQQESTVLSWIKLLPDPLIRARPALSVAYALVLLNTGQLEAVEARLQDAERALAQFEPTVPGRPPAAPAALQNGMEQYRSLPASIANTRAFRAQALGDFAGAITYAQQALTLLPTEDDNERAVTAAFLGLAYWTNGDVAAAHQSFAEGLMIFQTLGIIQIAVCGTLILANMGMAQGRLRATIATCEQALQLAAQQPVPILQGTPDLYLALSEIHYEQGDLATASQLLEKGEALREHGSVSGADYLWWLVRAQLTAAQGDLDKALEQLQAAARLYRRSPVPDVRPIEALKVQWWLQQGKLAAALNWMQECGLSVADPPDYRREYEHLTLARVLIAQYRQDGTDALMHPVIDLLTQLLAAAEAKARNGSIIKILMVLALARAAQENLPAAIDALERALILAEPEGYVRIFAECGIPMRQLLQVAMTRSITPTYTHQLLTTLDTWGQPQADSPTTSDAPTTSVVPVPQALIEPLSQRELDVLRLLNTELSGPEIARELVVALSTVRTHTKRIYSKLNVTNRRAAVKRAVELELI